MLGQGVVRDDDRRRVDAVLAPQALQAPGDVVYYRPGKEFAVAYGESRFCWESGPLFVTPVATIQDDLTEFAKKADQMVWKGAMRFVIRRKA